MSNQKALPIETPERSQIPEITRGHVAAMEASADGAPEAVWVMANMRHLLLRTVGRRSGRVHKVALPYWIDEGGDRIVVASYAGAPEHPAWYLNLADRDANPEVFVRTRSERYWSEPEVLVGAERAGVWKPLIEDRPFYAEYQTMTDRELPLVRLAIARTVDTSPD